MYVEDLLGGDVLDADLRDLDAVEEIEWEK